MPLGAIFNVNKATNMDFYLSNMFKTSLLPFRGRVSFQILRTLTGGIFAHSHELQTSLVVPEAIGHGIWLYSFDKSGFLQF